MALEFEWQPEEAAKNRRKHKVLFEEAATVFADEMSATLYDPDHSDDEERFFDHWLLEPWTAVGCFSHRSWYAPTNY